MLGSHARTRGILGCLCGIPVGQLLMVLQGTPGLVRLRLVTGRSICMHCLTQCL